MQEEETRTIRITLKTKKQLDAFKVHPRETYDDILNRIMESTKYLGVEEDER